MEIKKISRSLSYEMINAATGLKFWDKLSAEIEISEGDNPKEGYNHLKKLFEEVHQESFPNMESFLVHDTCLPAIDYKEQDKIAKADEEKAKYSSIVFTIRECKTKQQAEIVLGKNLEFLQYMQATDSLIDLIYEKFKS